VKNAKERSRWERADLIDVGSAGVGPLIYGPGTSLPQPGPGRLTVEACGCGRAGERLQALWAGVARDVTSCKGTLILIEFLRR
jgi:hypothetical protein